ncbi:UNVERIFIED_CONTAM: hypothetical protein NCL1_43188 [Trichonephila clavipes]
MIRFDFHPMRNDLRTSLRKHRCQMDAVNRYLGKQQKVKMICNVEAISIQLQRCGAKMQCENFRTEIKRRENIHKGLLAITNEFSTDKQMQ